MMTLQEQYVIDIKGNKTAVILPLKRYEQLMEDLHDLAIVAERREEKSISLEEMKQRLKEDGLLTAARYIVHCENQPMVKICGYGPSGPDAQIRQREPANVRAVNRNSTPKGERSS
jgi:hypothetical protein